MTTATIDEIGRDADGNSTVQHCLERASECCEAADEAEWYERFAEARVCYAEAEGWLWKADKLRGIDDGRPVFDARMAVERRMGLAN